MDRHQSEGPRKSARGSIGAKLALAGIAGVLIALFVVQQPLTQPLPNTLQMADMTWVEVRSAMRRGYTRVIVPSGGIEQNGPHMVLGTHDYIVGWSANEMAKELGQTLVAPVIPYVPEGDYDPPTGHLRFPGTIGIMCQATMLPILPILTGRVRRQIAFRFGDTVIIKVTIQTASSVCN